MLEVPSEVDLKATVRGQRQRGGDGPRICEGDAAQSRAVGVIRGEETTKSPVVRVEQVVHEAIELDVVVDVVRRVDVDLGVAAELRVLVGFIALEELTADGDEIGTKLPLPRQTVIETGLEGLGGYARKVVAGRDRNAKIPIPRSTSGAFRRLRIERRGECKGCQERRIDKAVARVSEKAIRSVVDLCFDALS